MLTEAQRAEAKRRSTSSIGYFEPHGRKDTMALTEGLETIPRKIVEYRGARIEEMDADAILRRRPRGRGRRRVSAHERARLRPREALGRCHVLLDAGIDVLTTMNVQHLESLNDQIWQSTGVRVRETIPDWVLKQADEVVMVDLTPRALLNRLKRGVVYAPEKAERALENFFRESTLVALRELAMRQTAHAVESRQPPKMQAPTDRVSRPRAGSMPPNACCLLIEPDPSSAALIRRGRRVADYLHADCLAVYVSASRRSRRTRRGPARDARAPAELRARACRSTRACSRAEDRGAHAREFRSHEWRDADLRHAAGGCACPPRSIQTRPRPAASSGWLPRWR